MKTHSPFRLFILLMVCLVLVACHSTRDIAQKAANGDRAAQFEYGKRLLTGRKAPKSPKRALIWFHVAAQQGHAGAEAALAVCFERGIGTPRDIQKARLWYNKALCHGHPHALLALADLELREKHPNLAIQILNIGSRADCIQAQLKLAQLYTGTKGIKENRVLAVDNIRYAAMAGSGEAAFLMSLCFAEGYGVPQQPNLAYGWLRNAADLHYEPAVSALRELEGTVAPVSASIALPPY